MSPEQLAKQRRDEARQETKIQRACAFLLFICGLVIFWICIGERIVHIILDILGVGVHPNVQEGQLSSIGIIVSAIVAAASGARVGKDYINYRREKDCAYRPEMEAEQTKTKEGE